MTEGDAFTLMERLHDEGFLGGIDCAVIRPLPRRSEWCVAVTPMGRVEELERALDGPLDGHLLRAGTYFISSWSRDRAVAAV